MKIEKKNDKWVISNEKDNLEMSSIQMQITKNNQANTLIANAFSARLNIMTIDQENLLDIYIFIRLFPTVSTMNNSK
jgi:hypothetical protein